MYISNDDLGRAIAMFMRASWLAVAENKPYNTSISNVVTYKHLYYAYICVERQCHCGWQV